MAKITALKYQKRNPDRVSVYLDGRFAFGLPAIVAVRLKPDQTLSEAEIVALKREGDAEANYNRALNYLSHRPRSRAEVERYFQKRGLDPDEIEATAARLERAGFLDDEAFARFWIENRERFRPRGVRALRYELRQKGIADATIDRALAAVDEQDSAYRSAEQKARQLGHLDREDFYRKLIGYLSRRGFNYGLARQAADRCWAELETDRD